MVSNPSRILHIIQVRLTGLLLPAFLRFPFLLNIADTFACFQSSGNCPSVNDLLNNLCNGLHICSHCSLSILGWIPSGPTDLHTFNLSSLYDCWKMCDVCDDGGYLFCSFLKDSSWEFVWARSFILVEIFQLFNYAVCAYMKRGHAGVQ